MGNGQFAECEEIFTWIYSLTWSWLLKIKRSYLRNYNNCLHLFYCPKYPKYRAGNKVCPLCLEEKLTIALYNEPNHLLNLKTEILNVDSENVDC